MEIQILGSTILLAIIIVGSAKIIESRIKFEVEKSEEIIKRDIDLKVKNNMIGIRHELVSHSVRFDKLPEEIKEMITQQLIGQVTDSVDVNGNDIWEGDLVNQKSVLVGDDEDVDFTGYVKFQEGSWTIDNGKNAIPLWSEHRENKIIE